MSSNNTTKSSTLSFSSTKSPPAVNIPLRPLSDSATLSNLYPAPTPPLPETPGAIQQYTATTFSPAPSTNGEQEQSPTALQINRDKANAANAINSESAPNKTHASNPTIENTTTSTMTNVTSPPTPMPPPKIAWRRKLVLVLVGLPARGKSYIAYKLLGYLRWRGLNASLFNVGKHRRHVAEKLATSQSSDFFAPDNAQAKAQRDEIAMEVLECMLDWLATGGDVSIFDATNTTAARRRAVLAHCQSRSGDLRVTFLESICDDARVLENNYRVKVANSPDYKDVPIEEALKDLKQRVENYEKIYESIQDDELSYIKLHNLASKVICNKIHGQLSHTIAAYLMSIHIIKRPIFFVRAGHSESDRTQQFQDRQILKLPQATTSPLDSNGKTAGGIGADFNIPYQSAMNSNLDQHGRSFATRLSQFIDYKVEEYQHQQQQHHQQQQQYHQQQQNEATSSSSSSITSDSVATAATSHSTSSSYHPHPHSTSVNGGHHDHHLPLVVYTSTLPRAIQTAGELKDRAYIFEPQSSLNMMDTGVCAGMSIDEIRAKMPEELDRWKKQKYRFRFPGGESQADKAKSLEPLVFELERQTLPVLVISHMSTLQVLMGYFWGSKRSVDSYYSLWIPQHHVLELIPHQYGWQVCTHDLSDEACADDSTWLANGELATKAASLPASPGHQPVPVDGMSTDEVERFNLQVVPQTSPFIKTVTSNASTHMGTSIPTLDTAASFALTQSLSVPQPTQLMSHDRSVSIPPLQQSPPPILTHMTTANNDTQSTNQAQYSTRRNDLPTPPKASIGKSSSLRDLSETNFYDA